MPIITTACEQRDGLFVHRKLLNKKEINSKIKKDVLSIVGALLIYRR